MYSYSQMNNHIKNIDLIVYHNNCPDGIAGVWCASYFNNVNEIYGCDAGKDPIIDPLNKNIMFIDICPSFDYIQNTQLIAQNIIILDHHKSNESIIIQHKHILAHFHNVFIIFDIHRSGCQLAWDYFFDSSQRPFFIDYIGDRDMWLWKLPHSKEINTALFELNYIDVNNLHKLNSLVHYNNNQIETLINAGQIIVDLNNKEINHISASALEGIFKVDNCSYRVWLTDNSKYRSEIGNLLCNKVFSDGSFPNFSVIWRYNPKSNEWWISLRGTDHNFDLSSIAQSCGGGGHKFASGFTIKGCEGFTKFFDII